MSVRIAFASYALIETSDVNLEAIHYLKESFAITKKKFWKVVYMIFPFLLGIVFIYLVVSQIESTSSDLINYIPNMLTFLLIDGVVYMVYYSVYRILKSND